MQLYPCYGLVNSLRLLDQQFPGVTPRGAPVKGQEGLTHLTESRAACLSRRKFYNVTRLLLLL